jgi:hypothetical protein
MVRDQVNRVDGERAAVHFLLKMFDILNSVSPFIVSMNNEFSPVVLWLALSQSYKDVIMIVLGVECAPLRKCHDQGKSQWIPYNGSAKSRWKVLLTEIVGDHGIADYIAAEHSNKFAVDGLGRESLHREKQAD